MRDRHLSGTFQTGTLLRAALLALLALAPGLPGCGGGGGGGGGGPPPPPPDNPFGWNEESALAYDALPRADLAYLVHPPSGVSLQDDGVLPVVRNQGVQGSCVAWAVGYYTKSAQEKLEEGWPLSDTDLNHTFSPAFIYNQRANVGTDGMVVEDAMSIVISNGCSTLATMPYDDGNDTAQPSQAARTEASRFPALSQRRFGSSSGLTASDIADMKTWLFEKRYPFVLAIPVYDSFADYRGENNGVLSSLRGGAFLGNHAITAVAYSDDIPGGGAFLVVNSWGVSWGASGFAWIPYLELQAVGARAYGLVDAPNAPAPVVSPTDQGNDTIAGAGVILASETRTGNVGDFYADPADWWKFSATAGSLVHVSMCSGVTTSVQMKLTDALETPLGWAVTATYCKDIYYTVPSTTTYFLKVYVDANVTDGYAISLTVQAGESNDTASGATSVAVNSSGAGSVGGSDPRDWWQVNLANSTPCSIQLSGLSGDLDLYLYTGTSALSGGGYLLASLQAGTAPEQVYFTPAYSGSYYLLVLPWAGAQSSYTLQVGQGSVGVDFRLVSFNMSWLSYTDRVTITANSLVVANDGPGDAGPYSVTAGLSRGPGLPFWYRVGGMRWTSAGLPSGYQNTWTSGTETIYKAGISPSGSYYVAFWADQANLFPEANEANNYLLSSSSPVSIP